MAGNPLQQMIPMVLQQVMQNPQMLQQIMQMASGPAGQGILQMLMGQQGQDPRWAEKFQAGSGQESPHPLPGSLGGGTPYPTFSPEQDDKAYLRELREDRLQPPRYPPPPGLTPEIMERIQRQTPREPNPRDFPEEYLYPGNPEPIAGMQPGLLMRLASLHPGEVISDETARAIVQMAPWAGYNENDIEVNVPQALGAANPLFRAGGPIRKPSEALTPEHIRQMQDNPMPYDELLEDEIMDELTEEPIG